MQNLEEGDAVPDDDVGEAPEYRYGHRDLDYRDEDGDGAGGGWLEDDDIEDV